MRKPNKEEVIAVMTQLKNKGLSLEEIAVRFGRTQQTTWAWGSKAKSMQRRVPCWAEFEALKKMAE